MFIVIHVIYNSTEVDKGVNLKLVHRRRILKTASRKPLNCIAFSNCSCLSFPQV